MNNFDLYVLNEVKNRYQFIYDNVDIILNNYEWTGIHIHVDKYVILSSDFLTNTRGIVDVMKNKLTSNDEIGNITIYAKRISFNIVKILIMPINIKIIITNFANDINIIKNKKKIWKIYYLIHMLTFFESYNLKHDHICKLKEVISESKSKKIYLKYNNFSNSYYNSQIIIIPHRGSHIEGIYIGKNIKQFISSFHRYEREISDHEMRGIYYNCYNTDGGELHTRIYSGGFFCYKKIYGRNKPHWMLIVRFLLLDNLFGEKYSISLKHIKSFIKYNISKHRNIFNICKRKIPFTMYGLYIKRLFIDSTIQLRPWTYVKHIKHDGDLKS